MLNKDQSLTAIAVVFVALLLPLLTGHCASATAAPTVLTDLSGRKVSIELPARRIVALQSALAMICYLELCDQVVGVEDLEVRDSQWVGSKGRPYRIANPQLGELPVIGSRNQPDPERLLQSGADLIVVVGSDRRFADNLQQKTGIPVLLVDNGDLAGKRERFYASLRLIGQATGGEHRATAVIDRIETAIQDIRRRSALHQSGVRPTTYIGGLNFRVAHGITGTSADYPPFKLLGVINIADQIDATGIAIKGRYQLNPEFLLQADPDPVFISLSGVELVRQELQSPVYQELSAAKKRRFYGIIPRYYSAGPHTVLAETYYMGTILFPDAFADIHIADLSDDLYRFFLGRPLYQEMTELFGGFAPLDLP